MVARGSLGEASLAGNGERARRGCGDGGGGKEDGGY